MQHSNFSKVLKELRLQQKVTQEELAAYLHVSRSTIAGYETRGKQPDFDKLTQMADYFNVSIDFLVTGKTPDSPHFVNAEQLSSRQLEISLLQIFHKLPYLSKLQIVDYAQLLKLREALDDKQEP